MKTKKSRSTGRKKKSSSLAQKGFAFHLPPLVRKIALRVEDVAFWFMILFYSIGGIHMNGRLKFTYVNDIWVACAGIYVAFRFLFGIHFGETSFGKSIHSAFEALLHSIQTRSTKPIFRVPIGSALLMVFSAYLVALFFLVPQVRYFAYGATVFDLGVIENVVYNGANNGGFFSYFLIRDDGTPTFYIPNNRLNFGLFFFALIYKVIPSASIMLFFQSLALLSALVPLYLLGDRVLPKSVPRWLPLVAYWCFDPIHRMNLWDWHGSPFMIPFGLWALYFIESRKLGWALVHMVLMAIWREDAWLSFAGFAAYGALRTRNWKVFIPAGLAGLLVLPLHAAFFNEINSVGGRYPYLGPNMESAIKTALTQPWVFLEVAFENLKFWTRLLLASGGLFFLSGWPLFALIPNLAEVGLSQHGGMLSWVNHYIGTFTAPLFFCMIWGWSRAYQWVEARWSAGIARGVVGASLALCFSQLYVSEPGAFKMALQGLEDARCYDKLVEMIPADARIIAGDPIAARLTHREWISLPNEKDLTRANWLLIKRHEKSYLKMGLKGKNKVGNWKLVEGLCGHELYNR